MLNQAGLAATLPHLEGLTRRWELSAAGAESPLWREADELCGLMLGSWPSWRAENDTHAATMLDLLARLGNVARIDAFVLRVSGEGDYAAADNEAILRALALLPGSRATDLLIRIIERNASTRVGDCAALLRLCAAAPADPVGDLARVAAGLIDVLPGDPAKKAPAESWERPARLVTPGFVVDLLAASSRIDPAIAARAIAHMLAWPKTYTPDGLLVPAALSFAKQGESMAWPAIGRLREAALDHLRKRIALPLEAPRDWARVNKVKCTCTDCRELGTFLVDARQREWLLRAVQHRRTHVEESIRKGGCDLDVTTVRAAARTRWSPPRTRRAMSGGWRSVAETWSICRRWADEGAMSRKNRRPLGERVVEAAEAALAAQRFVSPIDVLSRIGWLDPGAVQRWRQGQVDYLEGVIQANLPRISEAMKIFRGWAVAKGLTASQTNYVARTPRRQRLRFSRSGDPGIEERYRTHRISGELSEKKRERLAEKASRSPDLVVIQPLNSAWKCHRCNGTGDLLIMDGTGSACLRCAGLGDLEFLPAGDALLTRRVKARSARSAVVVRFSRNRKRYERQGLLVEPPALAPAQSEMEERQS